MAKSNLTKTAVLYARFSPRIDAADCESIARQFDRCREYCRIVGHVVDESRVFFDEGKSGADADRPGLWAAVESLAKDEVLVVRWFSRLARDSYLMHTIERDVLKAGASIESADGEGTIEVSMTPEQRLIIHVLRGMDQYQRELIGIRTSLGMLRNQRNGRRQGRVDNTPWGWKTDPNDSARMVPCNEEQEAMDLAYEWHENGTFNYGEIASKLNKIPIPARGGREWNRNSVRQLLLRRLKERERLLIRKQPLSHAL